MEIILIFVFNLKGSKKMFIWSKAKIESVGEWVVVMVFNATFNNISIISWLPVLLVEETGVPGDNHRPVASHWQTWSRNVVSSTLREYRGRSRVPTVWICLCKTRGSWRFCLPNCRFFLTRFTNHLIICVVSSHSH